MAETLMGVGMLGIFAGVLLVALSTLNGLAAVARNQTAARIAVQSEIDRLLRVVYSPPVVIPAEFATAGQPDNRTVQERTVVLFREGAEGPAALTANLTTVAEPLDAAARPRLLRLTVAVRYTFRGRPYGVEAATVRSPDI